MKIIDVPNQGNFMQNKSIGLTIYWSVMDDLHHNKSTTNPSLGRLIPILTYIFTLLYSQYCGDSLEQDQRYTAWLLVTQFQSVSNSHSLSVNQFQSVSFNLSIVVSKFYSVTVSFNRRYGAQLGVSQLVSVIQFELISFSQAVPVCQFISFGFSL